MTELIFHVGAGKTGTSSIQETLNQNHDILKNLGICYWGLMLEKAPYQRYEWQHADKTELFYNTHKSSEQLLEVLCKSLEISNQQGYAKAIWSNEWFMGANYEYLRNLETVSTIEKLAKTGARIRVVAYIREHVSWALSAYSQWSLKDKTYTGPMKSFIEYTRTRPPKFSMSLTKWKDAVDDRFIAYNFSTCDDTAKHFLDIVCKVPADEFKIHRVNESPDPAEQFLRAAFNEIFPEGRTCTPTDFDIRCKRKLERYKDQDLFDWYSSLFPSDRDIVALYASLQEDINIVNEILTESGEAPLIPSCRNKPKTLSAQEIHAIASCMTNLAFHNAQEIEFLTSENRRLKSQIIELQSH